MTKTREEVMRILLENIGAIKQYQVKRLGLFGSVAQGRATQNSDLDFVVEFEKKTFDGYMDLKMFLEKLFNSTVDLVIADSIKPRLRSAILNQTIYAKGL